MRTGRVLAGRVLLALVLGVALMAAPGASGLPGVIPGANFGPATVRAATPGLTIVAAARYDVRPAQRLVHIALDLTLTNRLQDTKTSRYYFDQAFLSVLPGTSGYRLTWAGSGTPSVGVSKKTTGYTLLRLGLAARIFGGQTASYRLTFDLRDPGGAATRDLRISDSLVSFPVWAFATNGTSGSSSMVVFPAGYDVRVEAGSIPAPTTLPDGRTVFRTGALAEPLKFFAYLVADRPASYRQATIPATVEGTPIQVVLRSWPDDQPWATRVSDLLRRGLPALGDAIGLPWSHTQPLTVQEALSRSTQGYAGLFDPNTNRVEIAYFADSFVVLHESAHGWFNGALLTDRWANEAFASFYAEQAAAKLKIAVKPGALTPKLRTAAIPLNAWGPVGAAGTASEDYAYAASLQLAREIGKRAGLETLKKVWADAASHTGAYQPPAGPTETADTTVDWRGLLDLLEERTGTSFDDLWRTWVARPDDLALLDARQAARTKYAAVLAKTDGWALPKAIRDALRSWRFADATTLLDQASGAIDQRAQVEAAATKAGLSAPTGQPAMRAAFENDASFTDVAAVAQAELKAAAGYQRAQSMRRPVQPGDVITMFGMWGQTPDADLAAARDAFARGATDESIAASNAAALAWADAEAIGRGRVLSLVLLLVAALLGLLVIVSKLNRRRRRRRHHAMMARRIREGSQIVD